MKVKYCEYALADNYGTHIEINKSLKKDKLLRDWIIKHELGHKSQFDLLHEIQFNTIIVQRLIPFIIKNPKTLVSLSPIYIRKDEIIYDKNMIILYGIFIFLTIPLYYIINLIL